MSKVQSVFDKAAAKSFEESEMKKAFSELLTKELENKKLTGKQVANDQG